jgi:nitrosocyanin
MKNNIVIVLVLIVLAAGGIWYVSGSKPQSDTMGSEKKMMQETVTPADSSSPSGIMEEGTVKEITVEGSEFKFAPETLTFKKGETVRLTLKNTGKMPHDFVIDELGVKTKVINGGESDTVEFTPDKSGSFEYYCSVGKHREMGMKGTATVE